MRQEITSVIQEQSLSAKEISALIRISEKDVYAHLEHIQKAAKKHGYKLIVTPAECRKCDFVFKKRERLKKPGKCPVCRNELIKEPVFSI